MAEVGSQQKEKSLSTEAEEDEMLIEITEDQINELLPDDEEEEAEFVNGNASPAPSQPEKENGIEDAEEESGIALSIESAVSITTSEYQSTGNGESKRKSPLLSKPNKRKRSDPMHILKTAPANVPVRELLTLLQQPVLAKKPVDGTTEGVRPKPPPSNSGRKKKSPPAVDVPFFRLNPTNSINMLNMPTSVSQTAATLQLVSPVPLRAILPKAPRPERPASPPPPIQIPSPSAAAIEIPSPIQIPSGSTSPVQASPPAQKSNAPKGYRLMYKDLNPSLPLFIIRVPIDYVWLFRMHTGKGEPSVPAHLHITLPAPTQCRVCSDHFYTSDGLLFHQQRQCTLISFSCSACGSVISATNKCAFIHLLASHKCLSTSKEVDLSEISVKPICPQIHVTKKNEQEVAVPTLVETKTAEVEVVAPLVAEVVQPVAEVVQPVAEVVQPVAEVVQPVAEVNQPVAEVIQPVEEVTAPPSEDEPNEPESWPTAKETAVVEAKVSVCPECKITMQGSLSAHLLGDNSDSIQLQRCEACYMHLMTPCQYSAHMRIHGTQAPYVCPECGQDDWQSREIFMKHVKKVCLHFNRCLKMSCKHCDQDFVSQVALAEHLHRLHSPSYYKCSACPMAFKTTGNFHKHQQQHLDADNKHCSASIIGKCPSCDKLLRSFNTNVGRIHIMSHSLKQNCKSSKIAFKCMQCKSFYNNKTWLIKHLRVRHPEMIIMKNLCKYCGWEALSKKTLLVHIKMIHNIDDESDAVFGKEMEGDEQCQGEEEEEEEVEEVEEPVEASKESSERSTPLPPPPDLEEPRPESPLEEDFVQPWKYECDQCQMVFESLSVFDRHMKKHRFVKRRKLHPSPEKKKAALAVALPHRTIGSLCAASDSPTAEQLQCPHCDLSFGAREDLEQHMQSIHQQERHFSCHLCGVTYTDKICLEAHVKSSHEKRIRSDAFVCCVCQRCLKTLTALIQHLKSHKVPKNEFDKFITDSTHLKVENCDAAEEGKKLRQDGDTLFTCAKCSFTTEDEQKFSEHIQLHKLSKSAIQCSECGLCFSVVPALKRHLLMVHKIRNNVDAMVPDVISLVPKPCSVPLTPVESLTLGNSLKVKNGETANECLVCYRSFNDHNDLRKHMRTHGMAFIQSKRALNKAQSTT